MGDLIEFPMDRIRKSSVAFQGDLDKVEVEVLEQLDECTDVIHVFLEVPGRCKCGENEWTPDHTIEPDVIGLHAVYDPPPAS